MIERERNLLKLMDRIEVSTEVMSRVVGDETVLLDLASGTYFGLNAVGARIWELIGEGKSIAEACEILLREFDTSKETIESDALSLGESLLDRGLIRVTAVSG
jgi:Coenzyme PQQ synthesis protein D (PqqD)